MWRYVALFSIACGLSGEAFEILRLRQSGIVLPGVGLPLTLFCAYAVLAAAFACTARVFFRHSYGRVAAAFFAVTLAVPWVNFDFLPAAGSLRSIFGSIVAAAVAAAFGWVVSGLPRLALVTALALAVVATSGSFAASSRERQAGSTANRIRVTGGSPNLLVILIDTLRADHLGVYGYRRPTSPNIDRLAGESVVFERALAQASWTKPSVASLFTGRFVHNHGVIRSRDVLDGSIPTLATVLDGAGYHTAAFSGNPWITPEFRFDRGFDHFESGRAIGPQLTNLYRTVRRTESLLKRNGIPIKLAKVIFRWAGSSASGNSERDEVLRDNVVQWLSEVDRETPFFLYLHLIGPHDPYDPPGSFAESFARNSEKAPHLPPPRVQTVFERADPMSDGQLERLIDQYDAAIAHSDSLVGEVVEHLDRVGLGKDTVVVITADHGEEFYEHRNWRHGNQLYDEVIRVPLIIRMPGQAPRLREDPVMLVDLLPTLLGLAGVDAVSEVAVAPDGRSLFPPPEGGGRLLFSEHWWFQGGGYVARAVEQDGLKLHSARDESSGRQREEAYDLPHDAGERNDLLTRAARDSVWTDRIARLREVQAAIVSAERPVATSELDDMDEATKDRLRALGYLEKTR